jgi:S1-C subfamily serine protease
MSGRAMCLWLMAAVLLLTSCGGKDEQTTSTTTNGTDAEATAGPPESDIYFGALDVRPATGTAGLFVRGYERGSPVATAGILHGDVIIAVDGARVRSASDMIDALNSLPTNHDAADVVRVQILRRSQQRTLEVTLGANVYLGTNVQAAPKGERGVLVLGVKNPGAEAGIRKGDLIKAVDGEPVATVDELFAALGEHQAGDEVEVTLARESGTRTVAVILAPRPHLG